jgi:hypothetical protein
MHWRRKPGQEDMRCNVVQERHRRDVFKNTNSSPQLEESMSASDDYGNLARTSFCISNTAKHASYQGKNTSGDNSAFQSEDVLAMGEHHIVVEVVLNPATGSKINV